MKRAMAILLPILFLTAAYIYAWPSAGVPYFAAVIVHALGGLALVVLLVFALDKILDGAPPATKAGWFLIAFGGTLGVMLIFTGTRRTEWPLLYIHIAACVVGGTLIVADWMGHHLGYAIGVHHPTATVLRCAFFLTVATALSAGAYWLRKVPWERSHRIENPSIAPASMDSEGDGPSGPFFPSSAQTLHHGQIPASYFMESQSCERCHSDIYKQWQSSAHHFSSFNNAWYRKSIEYMQDVVGVKPSKWCAGCHDPALLYSGMFDRPIREIEDTPPAQAGLGCMMCHSIAQVKSTMGQADFELEYPALHKLAASKNPITRRVHDYLTELNPEPHRRVFLKPFMRTQTSEFCSTCHKVHLDVPVNHYRWTRGFNDYDNWQASGVGGQGARSFYYPAKPIACPDCHMPAQKSADAGAIAGAVHSHRFPAANTALPFVNNDANQLDETSRFLTDKELSVDIFAISPESPEKKSKPKGSAAPAVAATPGIETTFAVGEESAASAPVGAPGSGSKAEISQLTAPLDRSAASVRRDATYRLDVVVRTRKMGHFFPGGTVDAFDCWLELSATDDKGRVIFWSGRAADEGKGPVDPGAHFYRSLLIDSHGNPINKRNAWSARATVYAHLIPPGAADTAHFRLQIPRDAGNRIHVVAKLNYRKFAWWNTQFSFASVPDPAHNDAEHKNATTPDFDDRLWLFTGDPSKVPGGAKGIPVLPIVVVAQNAIDLNVLPAKSPEPAPTVQLNPDDWTRWNDYGIGLFLQGDLTGAAAAFTKATQIDPKNPDGWVNLGRVRVQEGNLPAAREVLDRALALKPDLARAHYFYSRVLRSEGRHDEAASHLREVIKQYPRDRVVHDDLGRILFLQRRYIDAITEFQSTLAIDPEDLEANYNLMLCYTGLNQSDRAAEFQKRYLRFKADEAAQTLTGPYRRNHPEDNLERQSIHEHVSEPLVQPKAKSKKIRDELNEPHAQVRSHNSANHERLRLMIQRPAGFSGAGTLACALSLALGLTFTSPAQSQQSRQSQQSPAPPSKIHFEDITHQAGLHFTHNNAAAGKKYLPETMGSGVAFLDYDNDGWQDILLVNGEDWPNPSPSSASKKHHSTLALYHNNHDGTFTDVTQKAGIAVEMMGMGVAIGDYDNDGFDDIFITALGQSRLFHNNGNGTFTDVTQKAGLAGPHEFSTAAAWVDYDRDGHLDLVVGNYVQWTPETDIYCTLDGKTKSYCTPESYKGASVRLWHNRGNGTFEDATQKAGLFDTSSKSLGIAILDANQDGWPDIFVSNDTQPNKLYMNNTNGTFTEKAVPSGVAYSEDGVARAGMGVAAADYDRSGYPSLIITNFSNQMLAFYHNERNGLFVDEAPHSEVGRASLLTLGFGCFFFDYDLDGWPDIYIANGHIDDAIERVQPRVRYAEPPHLFRNLGAGKFAEVTDAMGRAFAAPRVARGAAYGDINNDGALDVLVSTNGGPASFFKNTGATNHSLRIKLVGTKSNRDGLGAKVLVMYGNGVGVGRLSGGVIGGETQMKTLTSGGSYLSSSELILTFGLGDYTAAEVIVRWPSGQGDETIKSVPADQIITIKEGSGIIASAPLAKR